MKISLKEYFGPYYDNVANTLQMQENAVTLLQTVNTVLERAALDGVAFLTNPFTGNVVSGQGHGGFRAPECTVGAENSQHRQAHAVDIYDPKRHLQSWCIAHEDYLKGMGLCCEDFQWTVTMGERPGMVIGAWVHFQNVPVHSGRTFYIPNDTPPLASVPSPWEHFA
jgi:hypothetical protein